MTNDILDAVTTQLGNEFGDGYRYYMEDVEQNVITPCFTVNIIQPFQRSRSPKLYDRTMQLVVHYLHNDRTEIKRNAYAIGERLNSCLEYLPFRDTLLRGDDLNWKIVDDVLQFFATYRMVTTTYVPDEPMTDMAQPNITSVT